MWKFLPYLYKDVPTEVFVILLLVLIVGVLIVIKTKGTKNGWRTCGKLSLLLYLILIYSTTVLFRSSAGTNSSNFTLFWSYYEIAEKGGNALLYQNICNILVFIPLGILSGIAFHNHKLWHAICMGASLSATIELSQFFLKRGFTEFDDVFHNVFGCMIGYGLYTLISSLVRMLRVKR